MRDLEDQLRRYGHGVEALVPDVDVPSERPHVRRWPILGAAAAVVLAVVATTVALSSDGEEDRLATTGEPPGDPIESVETSIVDGCVRAERLPDAEGLVGEPVTEVLPSELRDGFVPGRLWAHPTTGPELEGVWYVVSTVLTDVGGRPLGVGLWLMPDSIVARAGDGWHQYPANSLAATASSGLRELGGISIERSDLEAAEDCAGDGTAVSFIEGELRDGGTWIVADDPDHGLCVTLRTIDLGCDDAGPVVPADAPDGTLRFAIGDPSPEFSFGEAGELAYAELPEGATEVRLTLEDGTTVATVTADLQDRLWAAPVVSGDLPVTVDYLDETGTVIASFDRIGA